MNPAYVQSTDIYAQAVARCEGMRIALIILLCLFAFTLLLTLIFTILDLRYSARVRQRGRIGFASVFGYITLVLLLVTILVCYMRFNDAVAQLTAAPNSHYTEPESEPVTDPSVEATAAPTEPALAPETLNPKADLSANPANWGINWQISTGGELVDNIQTEASVSFGKPENYYPLPGISTFRGDNYRTGAAFGTSTVTQTSLSDLWSNKVGTLDGWIGVGWTGQPLCVLWDEQTKAIMNLYDSKKEKENLIEVICTTLDGNIYFYDLEDGSATRDPIKVGMSFKGTATLDPRGYPILYAGSGLVYGKNPRMYAINLIDGTVLWERDGTDSFAKRSWYAFDSSPLVSADADTLIWPGESGILYTIKLNTQYDPAIAALSQLPEEIAKVRYTTGTGNTVGFESSSIIVDHYLYIGDNGGMFFCVDLNTMQLMWAQNVENDLKSTPVFEWGSDGRGYLYLATSMVYETSTSTVFKIDANSGAIVWKKPISGITNDGNTTMGILSSPVLGKPGTDLEGILICGAAKSNNSGTLFALDTQNGKMLWDTDLNSYTWSSPVALYTESNKSYIVMAEHSGQLHLVDGGTGDILYSMELDANVEASPVAFGQYIVIGTRGGQIRGIEVK